MIKPSLFDEIPSASPLDYHAVPVRSHLRRVKGSPATPDMDGRMDHIVDPNKMINPAPHNGTHTSRVAAIAVAESGKASTYRERVLECIREAGTRGITRADIEAKTGLMGNTIRPRVYELMGRQKDTEGSYPAPLVEEIEEVRLPDCGGKIRQKVLRAL